ncbi:MULTISPECIES: helix-turn-helix domain-containing protein [Actinokineospora]|uniref:helix-turn-helix domain-containing protein n=1 Tax=Actinokineospora TaxID=39845 RepID=UPI0016711F3F|nr:MULTISPECIES: helix-turn-helix transcriptional regulator [Actinokineospora]
MTEPPPPFATGLRAAIAGAGVTLEKLAAELRGRGTPVSLATLSYWCSGRSRPERARSLAALAELEDLLGLPAGGLRRLLPERRPRGWAAKREVEPITAAAPWHRVEQVRRLLDRHDLSRDGQLSRLSAHDRVEIGADRVKRVQHTRQVLRAEQDGIDRIVVVCWGDGPDSPAPVVVPVRNCSVGQVDIDDEAGLVAAELVFDRPLARRETIVVEHALHSATPPIAVSHQRISRLPVREYLIEVCFHPAALPHHCVQFSEVDGMERVRAVDLDSEYTAHALGLDLPPGKYGLRWSW